MIDKKEIQHIAGLVKIKLSVSDIKKYQKQLEHILDYVSHLQKVQLQGVKSYQDLIGPKNVFREDKALVSNAETVSKLLKEVPEKHDCFIRTRNPLQ